MVAAFLMPLGLVTKRDDQSVKTRVAGLVIGTVSHLQYCGVFGDHRWRILRPSVK